MFGLPEKLQLLQTELLYFTFCGFHPAHWHKKLDVSDVLLSLQCDFLAMLWRSWCCKISVLSRRVRWGQQIRRWLRLLKYCALHAIWTSVFNFQFLCTSRCLLQAKTHTHKKQTTKSRQIEYKKGPRLEIDFYLLPWKPRWKHQDNSLDRLCIPHSQPEWLPRSNVFRDYFSWSSFICQTGSISRSLIISGKH